ncbi:hypothetical protein [Paenibacillus sp. FSL H8-0034]|uniref:hypothetical protein n=1 Tax=Paenibacillus sp. FSL H8-0034 TaxID=2954671 RepID=UPI0030FBE680
MNHIQPTAAVGRIVSIRLQQLAGSHRSNCCCMFVIADCRPVDGSLCHGQVLQLIIYSIC